MPTQVSLWVLRPDGVARSNASMSRQAGKEGPGALGYSGQELVGTFVAGNDFNYVKEHADALRTAKAYNVVSQLADALESGSVRMADYSCTDLATGTGML